jgi:hypothetical protein
MDKTATPTTRRWRHIERYVYVERAYEDVWSWLAGHLSTLGEPLPGGGRSVELRLRPGGREVTRPVRLHIGGLVAGEASARAALGWVDAAHPQLFPQLEAVLEIAPVPSERAPFTQIGVIARYHPPLGPLGAIGDRLVGAEVTDAALTAFLDELAGSVADNTTPPSRRRGPETPADQPTDHSPLRRLLRAVDGLAVRRGGAVGAHRALMAVPGVARVGVDPWCGLVAVDHDSQRCGADDLMAALDGGVGPQPA